MMNQELIDKVRVIVEEESDELVTADMSFVALGLDSLEFLCVVNRVRNELGPVDDTMISQIRTVKDLAAAAAIGRRK
jgi:acyl carrier protein